MRKLRTRVAGIMLIMLTVPLYARAQQQDKASADESVTRLRLDIVLSEYDGSKEVDSLPYTLFLESGQRRPRSVRMGLKIPIVTGTSGTGEQINYQDIGTDIDAWAAPLADDSYDLDMNVDRSSVYSANQGADATGRITTGGSPVVRSFRSSFDLGLRDGQTTQGPSATDPFNGHVLKISVTLHVIK